MSERINGKKFTGNPRKITRAQFARLKKDLLELGDLAGVVHDLNSNEFVGGNQRSDAFDINSCEIEIVQRFDQPDQQGTVAHGFVVWQGARYAYRQVRWTPEQCRRANVIANLAGGTWDFPALSDWGEPLVEWGMDNEFLTAMQDAAKGASALIEAAKPPVTDDPGAGVDRAEELREKWGVATGDLWIIPSKSGPGEHRIICGDCTDPAVVARVMGGESADCVVADAPYGMMLDTRYADRMRGERATAKNYSPVFDDDKQFDPRPAMSVIECKEQFWFGADYYAEYLPEKNFGSWLIWDKRAGIEGADFTLSEFETIWSAEKHARKILRHRWMGVHGMESQDVKTRMHPTQKPVELIRDIIEIAKGSLVVYDPFLGSGTTLVACEQLSRQGRGVEIAPAYVGVCLERLALMGLEPRRAE